MKKLILSAALALATLVTVEAQNALPTTINGGTNNIAASATNTYNIDFVLPQNTRMLSLEAVAALNGAGTGTGKFNLSKSVDASTNSYVAVTNVTLTFNGTTAVQAIVDVDPGGARYWRWTTGANTNSAAMTNINLTAGATRSSN